MPRKSQVFKAGSYPVYVDGNFTNTLDNFLSLPHFKKSRIFLIADENTSKYCVEDVIASSAALKDARLIEIPSGEKFKNIETCSYIWNKLIRMEADRHSLVINVGGGMVTDLGGFAAATYKRGIRYVNIPTTLIGQIDASLGGKVGIDHDNLKNQIGLFFDPQAVFIQTKYLKTLRKQEIMSGFAEMAKHGLISDAIYWRLVMETDPGSTDDWFDLVARSVDIKLTVVLSDPMERKYRKVLNFGHTVGHALESYHLKMENLALPHGSAVAAGIVCAAYISRKKAGLSLAYLKEITGFINKNFKCVEFSREDIPMIIEDMKHDKKNEDGKIMFTLLPVVGHAVVNKTVPEEIIAESLEYYLEECGG